MSTKAISKFFTILNDWFVNLFLLCLCIFLIIQISAYPDKAVLVPYAGGGPASTALIRGGVDFYSGLSTTTIRFVRSGKVPQIAVLRPEPLEVLPDTPTIYQPGYKDWEYIPFSGVCRPSVYAQNRK